jgi:dTDP-4-dehydrorhamnose reductase
MAKKILVVGANGLLGQSLVKRFRAHATVTGCDLHPEYFDASQPPQQYERLDITNRQDVKRFFGRLKPDVVINAAAMTDVDGCEVRREDCWNINVKSIELMLEACAEFDVTFVQISTDYVFNGWTGAYREQEIPSPAGYYGKSKYAAERLVQASDKQYIIARTQVLYGAGVNVRPNFATWLIKELGEGRSVRIVNDQIGNPTHVEDLAEAIRRLIDKEEYGVFHISGSEKCSRYDFAVKLARIFNLDEALIQEITTAELRQKAPRPMNSTFVLDKLHNTLDWLPADNETGLRRLKSQL